MVMGGNSENRAEMRGSTRTASGSVGWKRLYTCWQAGRCTVAVHEEKWTGDEAIMGTTNTVVMVRTVYRVVALAQEIVGVTETRGGGRGRGRRGWAWW
ncbi:hypothetical protein E2C01_002806 [Portunus trituberculatus]|uniref:Uncharacterized protein n=1 Tax=Portunus trituberculatus TaxID=210409 RepID=A0A5B7CKQ6_PORTR|nr:hypothetical protein [Portunus trituberculatus]